MRLFSFIYTITVLQLLNAARLDVETLRRLRELQPAPELSPLDEEYYDSESDLGLNLDKMPSMSFIPTWDSLKGLPNCQKECNEAFSEAMKVAFKAENNMERFYGVCKNYQDGVDCQDRLVDCTGREVFDVMTSGLNFMCIRQKKAFEKVIGCLDEQAGQVQMHCEKVCRGRNHLTNWAAQSGLLDLFSYDKAAPKFDGEQFRAVMQDVCELAKCYLTCVRTSYNKQCGHSAGTLISEAVVRPMAESQSEPLMEHMGGLMNLFMPHQCGFITNKEALEPHRIDPHLDEALRRDADLQEGDLMSNATNSLDEQDLLADMEEEEMKATAPNFSEYDNTEEEGMFDMLPEEE